MRLPSKVTPFAESTLAAFPVILSHLTQGETTIRSLYAECGKDVGGITEFVDSLDCLFALGKIELTAEGVLRYVD